MDSNIYKPVPPLPGKTDQQDRASAKEQAAEEKTQVFSILKAIQDGRMPHNDQLHDLLTKLLDNRIISSRAHLMSQDGQILLNDFRALIKTIQKALHEKNKDELFQSLVYHLHCIESPLSKDQVSGTVEGKTDQRQMQQEGKQGANAISDIGKLILFNDEFRSVLGELVDIFQDIFTNMSSDVGDSLKQTGDKLHDTNGKKKPGRQIVDEMIDKGAQAANNNNNNNSNNSNSDHYTSFNDNSDQKHQSSMHQPLLNPHTEQDHRLSGLTESGDSVYPGRAHEETIQPSSLDPTKNERGSLEKSIHPADQSCIPQTDVHGNLHLFDNQTSSDMPFTSRLQGATDDYNRASPDRHMDKASINSIKSGHQGLGMSEEQRAPFGQPHQQGHSGQQGFSNQDQFNPDQVKNTETYQKAENEFEQKKNKVQSMVNERIPEEKQHELLDRLRSVIGQVQSNPEYQSAIDTIVRLLKSWSDRFGQISQDIQNKAENQDNDQQSRYRDLAERETKVIIESWAQGQSMDPLLEKIRHIKEDMNNDDELRHYYDALVHYLDNLARKPGYASDDKSVDDGRKLMDDGNRILEGKYGDHIRELSDQAKKFIHALRHDKMVQELNDRISTIHRHLWWDRDGNPAFKPQLMRDIKLTLLPAFLDEIKFIPIPRIEYSDAQFDVIIENLVLSGDSLLPNNIQTKVESYSNFSFREDVKTDPGYDTLVVRLNEIQADIDDVVFSYTKKTGFPKISDRGVGSLYLGGKGLTMTVRLQSVTDNPHKTFKVTHCKCKMSNLKFKINDSKHDILYKTLSPLITSIIRKNVARALEMNMIETLNDWDKRITQQITKINQNIQYKAGQLAAEADKTAQSQSRPQQNPGLFNTLVNLFNSSVKASANKRQEKKHREGSHRDHPIHGDRKHHAHKSHHSHDTHSSTHPHDTHPSTNTHPHDPFGTKHSHVNDKMTDKTNLGLYKKPRENSIVSPPRSPTQSDVGF